MIRDQSFQDLFRKAVFAMDSGDEQQLKTLLQDHPELAVTRLHSPGEWLTSDIGNALDSFFKEPYLLWFVSEDAVRNNSLPKNIASIASIVIDSARATSPETIHEQIDYALKLVAWSVVARNAGVQLQLLDVLIDAGAPIGGIANDALVNGNFDAARHLINRGGIVTLASALCLDKWDDAERLAASASNDKKQFSLVLAALNGRSTAAKKALEYGADVNKPSNSLYSHGTPLHHAACSGSLDTVKGLVDAGANLFAVDTIYNGTPLGWALYAKHEEIANYLKDKEKEFTKEKLY